jgi:hypothetical protein
MWMVDLLPERDRPPKMELGHSSTVRYSIGWDRGRASTQRTVGAVLVVSTERERDRSNERQPSPVFHTHTQLGEGVFDTQSELQVSISSGGGKIRSAEIAQGANRHHPRRAAPGC